MRKILRRILLTYRPIDRTLRSFGPYARLARHLQVRYNIFMADETASGRMAKVMTHYAETYEATPVDKKIILFESYWGKKIAGNPLAVYRALVRNYPTGSFKIYWTKASDLTPPKEIAENEDVTFVVAGTMDYADILLQAGYLVNNVTFPTWFIRKPNQRYCNTWHGIPMKAMGRDMIAPLSSMANSQRNFLQSDFILGMGDFYTWATLRPYYVERLIADRIFQTGAPRIDDSMHPHTDTTNLRQSFGISPSQKVVLFAPTWRGNSTQIAPAFGDQHAQYSYLAKTLGDDYFVLFSAHQMLKMEDAAPVTNGALLADNMNINDVISIVDVMISDYSSIIFDYLPLDRPIVLFTHDIADYRQTRGLYIEPHELPCADATTKEALITAVRQGKRPSEFATYKAACERIIPHEDGAAAHRVLTELFAPNKRALTAQPDGRKRILVAPGGMMPNGVTTSLKNLIGNIDYDQYDVYILINAATMDKDPERKEQFEEFDPRCNWILHTDPLLLTSVEKALYQKFRAGTETLTDDDLDAVKCIFKRENRRILGGAHFDIAIEFGGYAPFWCAFIAAANADRHVIYQHNHLWAEFSNTDPARNQKQLYGVFQTYRWFDAIVAVSEETRQINETSLAQFFRPDVTSRTVRNTINVASIQTRAQEPLNMIAPDVAEIFQNPAKTTFLALGRLSPEKRYDRMIKAFAKATTDAPHATLMICGRGPLKDELIHLIQKLDLTERVLFLGQIRNPYPLLTAADYLVMSSDYEGQPMALLEGLCLGTPCIGTDIAGIRSVLKDGQGHLVAPQVDALAVAMLAAINNTLPALPHAVFGKTYVADTMDEFYTVVCGTQESSHI